MRVCSVFRRGLRVTSKANLQEFYDGVKSTILIDTDDPDEMIRVEPGNLISIVTRTQIMTGQAPFVPSIHDEDLSFGWRYRRYINAYLT